MTAYNTIADSDIDPESPITTTLMTRLRDNAIAITEGSSGAPKIQEAAMDDESVDFNALINANYTTDQDRILSSSNGITVLTPHVWTKVATIIAPVNGQFNTLVTVTVGGGTGFARIYKNGVEIGTLRDTTTSNFWNEDLPFTANDKIQLYVYHSISGGTNTWDFELLATDAPAAAGEHL